MRIQNKLLFLFCFISRFCLAQELQVAIDHWLTNAEEDEVSELLLDQLLILNKEPVFINDCSPEKLYRLCMLENLQIQAILEHRKKHGRFISVYELQQIPYLSSDDIMALLPFIHLEEQYYEKKAVHQLYMSMELSQPFTKAELDHKYLGNGMRNRWRYSYRSSGFDLGIRLNKDAGEKFLHQGVFPFMDHSSAYLMVKDLGIVSRLIIGDLSFGYGQGLHLNTSAFVGGVPGLERSKINASGIAPYRSNNTDIQWTGFGARMEHYRLSLEYGYAQQYRDVSLDQAKVHSMGSMNGFHRSATEMKNRGTLACNLQFVNLDYAFQQTKMGIAASAWSMNRSMHEANKAYQLFENRSSHTKHISFHYEMNKRNMLLYGELMPSKHRLSWIQGVLFSMGKTDLCFTSMRYPMERSRYTRYSFSKWSNTAAETSHFLSIKHQLSKNIKSLYSIHIYRSDWLRSGNNSLIRGADHRLRITKKFSRQSKLQLDVTCKPNIIEHNLKAKMHTEKVNHWAIRCSINKKLKQSSEWRCRIERKNLHKQTASMLYMEYIGKLNKKLKYTVRSSIAYIPNSQLAIYSYERSPIGMNPSFAYYYSGRKNYALVQYQINSHLDLWFKYGLQSISKEKQNYTQRIQYGSSDNMRMGNRKHTFALQLRYSTI